MKLTLRTIITHSVLSTVLLFLAAHQAAAVSVTFTIDPGASAISLAGSFAGSPLVEQAPGSTTTSFGGTITVDVDDLFSPTSLETLGSAAIAAVNGAWLPESGGGPAASDPGTPEDGNYGLALGLGAAGTAFAAARDVVFDITGPAEVVAGGSFASTQTFTLASGVFDVNTPGFLGPPSTDDLTGDTLTNIAAASSYTVSGSTATLTIPVSMEDLDPAGLSFIYDGIIVATATIPEPSSIVLMLSVVVGMVSVVRRRKD